MAMAETYLWEVDTGFLLRERPMDSDGLLKFHLIFVMYCIYVCICIILCFFFFFLHDSIICILEFVMSVCICTF